ncbi:hypothetical protein LAZ67_X001476 [Cordylochernes scorpioides]|uniref:Helix-turn-helix domain-containing protein n=1 Tax=Cordylochernes scorpioides TaxID=51811 RepID=A0ABY6LTL4_9ARAC|nr:hypothetical protein LAZ67_X001476 [Cordylochernes scorpioides]
MLTTCWANGLQWERIVFTDEKLFTFEQVHNHQNDRSWHAEAPDMSVLVEHRQNTQSVMAWAGICVSCKTPLIFMDQGVRINQVSCRNILMVIVLLWAQIHLGNADWTFQQNQIYRQIKGSPMGSPLSLTVAEIVLLTIDEWINSRENLGIKKWRRYIDDIYCEYHLGADQAILDTLNSYHPEIKFTIEREENHTLPYLDALIFRNRNSFQTTVYYKDTTKPSYIPFNSYSPVSYKISVVKTLTKRLHTHCSLRALKEKENIYNNLRTFGYPPDFIRKHTFIPFKKVTLTVNRTRGFIDFSPTNQRIAHDLRKYGIQFTYRSTSTTGHILRNPITKPGVKHDVQHKSNAIYSVACNDCESVYVGETGRKIENRIKEHKYNISSKDPRSLLYQHTLNTGHSFDLDNPICHYNNIRYKGERLILESLGLPKGSILNPILFYIYLNDVHIFIKPPAKIALYADDIIWVSKNILSDAEHSLNKAMKNLQKLQTHQLQHGEGKQEQNRRHKFVEPSRIFQEVHQRQRTQLRPELWSLRNNLHNADEGHHHETHSWLLSRFIKKMD